MENLPGLIVFFSTWGLLVLLVVLLNLRDQRKLALCGVVFEELNSPDLRGLFTVKVRCRLFSRDQIVTIEMWNCSDKQIWDVIMRLSIKLPPHVWLVVNGLAPLRTLPPDGCPILVFKGGRLRKHQLEQAQVKRL